MRLPLITALVLALPAAAAACGGSFASFVNDLKSEAIAKGHA